jgi:DNA-directed RNA polymerase subunit H (RpoH/RPB5)
MDIMEHRYQPQFIQLTKDDMENVKNAWCATNEDIPKLKMSDPVAKYLGLKKNEIIKIIRYSPTSGEVIAYKIVS